MIVSRHETSLSRIDSCRSYLSAYSDDAGVRVPHTYCTNMGLICQRQQVKIIWPHATVGYHIVSMNPLTYTTFAALRDEPVGMNACPKACSFLLEACRIRAIADVDHPHARQNPIPALIYKFTIMHCRDFLMTCRMPATLSTTHFANGTGQPHRGYTNSFDSPGGSNT